MAKCSACKQSGHNKSSKKCPLYSSIQDNTSKKVEIENKDKDKEDKEVEKNQVQGPQSDQKVQDVVEGPPREGFVGDQGPSLGPEGFGGDQDQANEEKEKKKVDTEKDGKEKDGKEKDEDEDEEEDEEEEGSFEVKENTLNETLATVVTIDHAQVKDFTTWTIEETVNWGNSIDQRIGNFFQFHEVDGLALLDLSFERILQVSNLGLASLISRAIAGLLKKEEKMQEKIQEEILIESETKKGQSSKNRKRKRGEKNKKKEKVLKKVKKNSSNSSSSSSSSGSESDNESWLHQKPITDHLKGNIFKFGKSRIEMQKPNLDGVTPIQEWCLWAQKEVEVQYKKKASLHKLKDFGLQRISELYSHKKYQEEKRQKSQFTNYAKRELATKPQPLQLQQAQNKGKTQDEVEETQQLKQKTFEVKNFVKTKFNAELTFLFSKEGQNKVQVHILN